MFGFGTQELIIIFAILLVLFGASKLPELGKGLGHAINNFKKGIDGRDAAADSENKAIKKDD